MPSSIGWFVFVALLVALVYFLAPNGDPETGAGRKEEPDPWHSLDLDAAQNLATFNYRLYCTYRDQLKNEGHTWEEAKPILIGFIWND